MSRTVGVCNISVVSGALVSVSHHQRNGGAGSFTFKNAGKDLDQVSLFAGSGITALTRFSSVKENLDIVFREREAGRTSVYYSSKGFSVGFAPGGYFKFISK